MKEEIQDITLDPAAISTGGRGPPVAGVPQEACPFCFYTLRVPVVSPQGRNTVTKVL